MSRTAIATLFVIAALVLGIGTAGMYLRDRLNERNLSAKEQKRQDVSVTIVEGKRREEIAITLETAGICSAEAFLAATTKLEGTLFPDTYRFFPSTPVAEVVATFTTTFAKRTRELAPTTSDIILASIIEREARDDAERATISGVYTNRLKRGMKLDADPTVQYARDTAEAKQTLTFTYWGTITRADYKGVISPYNTYLNAGLPPGPIANAGVQSIAAAQNPATHDYLYFAHRDGKLLLSKTLAEHESKLR
ncbi:hypothetical protein BH11PAT4_BH11PAT4_5750 [soil metagenome]